MADYLHTTPHLDLDDHLNCLDEPQNMSIFSLDFLPDLLSCRYTPPLSNVDLLPDLEQATNAMERNKERFPASRHQEVPPTPVIQPSSAETTSAKPVNIFISFVKEDRKMLENLQKHLRVMQRQLERRDYAITIWHSGQVVPGQDWKEKIEHYLSTAHIILLLVSIDFLDSELCYAIQIQPAIDRHLSQLACVIPVILRPCGWQEERFGCLQPLPTDGVPVINWPISDEAYNDIMTGIRQAIANLPV